MKIIVARHSGFCFGVTMAVQAANDALKDHRPLYMLGEVVHNPTVIADLKKAGALIIRDADQIDLSVSRRVLVRAHGVGLDTLNALRARGAVVIDKTCPKVRDVHNIARAATQAGKTVLLVGDAEHPEVRGTAGWCLTPPIIVSDREQLSARIAQGAFTGKRVVCVVQTTFSAPLFDEMRRDMTDGIPGIEIHGTICPSTAAKQAEVLGMARSCDAMLIIGGMRSSNTMKLYHLARECGAVCYLSESADTLDLDALLTARVLGVAGGSSTPETALTAVLSAIRAHAEARGIDVEIAR